MLESEYTQKKYLSAALIEASSYVYVNFKIAECLLESLRFGVFVDIVKN